MRDRPTGLGDNQFQLERECDPASNFALQLEKVGDFVVEAFGPQMRGGCSVDQLGIDADTISGASKAAFEHITHTEFAADLLGVDGLVPISERGVGRDYESAG